MVLLDNATPPWPAYSNDTGPGTDGTVGDVAFFDALRDAIDALLHSTTNPTRSAADTTDEVVAARGSKVSLTARLDVALNADGTPIAQADQATVAQVKAQLASRNVALNGDLADWSAGGALAPDNFTLSGAGAAIEKTGPAQADTFNFGAGPFSAKITRAGADARLAQTVIAAADMAAAAKIRGKKIAVLVWGNTAIGNHLRIVVDDGVTTGASAYHAGDGADAILVATHLIDAAATKIEVRAEVNGTAGAARVGGFVFVFSDVDLSQWIPLSEIQDATATRRGLVGIGAQDIPGDKTFLGLGSFEAGAPLFQAGGVGTNVARTSGRLESNTTEIGNVGGGTDDLMTYSILGGTLEHDKQVIRGTAWGRFGATAANKTLTLVYGASSLLLLSASSQNNVRWRVEFTITRKGATSQEIEAILHISLGGGGVSPALVSATGAETLSGAVTVKFTCLGTNNDDIVQEGMILETVG